jgi:3-oxoacyl-[acyl-carrier protein] reductase
MDLGIAGRQAIVCGSTQGLGLACAASLAREGCIVYINGRSQERAERVAAELATQTGARVYGVGGDMTIEEGRQAILRACAEPDILVNNNAGPAPGQLEDFDHPHWLEALEANMLAPALLIRGVLPGMRTRKFGRIINVTSAMVKSPRPGMGLSTGARAGLTAFSKSLSVEVAIDNVTINNLLPERIDTDRQRFMAERMMRERGITMEQARHQITQTIAARRFGTPKEFGDACAYLCSVQASFISGQNLQLDGGSYHGLV